MRKPIAFSMFGVLLGFAGACGGTDVAPLDKIGTTSDSGVEPALDGGTIRVPDAGGPTVEKDAAVPSTFANPSMTGPFTVSVKPSVTLERGGRSIPVVARVPMVTGNAPLVVLLPGFQLKANQYALLAQHLASHGMIVVSADPPASLFSVSHTEMDLDVSAVIDWALTAASGLRVDSAKIATSGHSLGGKVAVMTASRDARVKAVFAIDPVNGAGMGAYDASKPNIVPSRVSGLAIPLGFVGETVNSTGGFGGACAPSAQNFETFYDAAAASLWVAKWDFAGANHMDFLDDVSTCGFVCSACTKGTAVSAQVAAGLRTIAAAFFQRHFLGATTTAEAFLTGASVPPMVTATKK
jgi:pimeloyl-ACP methyl ester carboxylesterase